MADLGNIRIVINPAGGRDRVLSVHDAMRQILDYVELLEAPQRNRDVETGIKWELVSATTNSPFSVEIAPYLVDANLPVSVLKAALDDAQVVATGLLSIVEQRELPEWLVGKAIETTKRVVNRNLNGIGVTEISVADSPVVLINSVKSETILEVLKHYAAPGLASIGKHQSRGEVTGRMIKVGEHYGRPAFWVLDKSGREVVCTLSEELVRQVGGETTLEDVWKNRRLSIRGVKHYDLNGKLLRIEALEGPELKEVVPVNLDAIIDRNFTGGITASEYIRRIRGEV